MKYLVVGYYGFRNTGDDAMLLGLLSELSTRYDDITILCGPDLAKAIFPSGIRFVPWSSLNLLKETIQADVVIIGGGTMLRDWGKGCLTQSIKVTAYLRLITTLGKQLFLVNIGTDSEKPLYRRIHRIALGAADGYSLRDDGFDSSILIPFNPIKQMRGGQETLGIMLTPFWAIYHNRPETDKRVVNHVVEVAEWWLSLNPKNRVTCISLNGHPVHSDDEINKQVADSIRRGAFFTPWSNNPLEIISELSRCTATIAMRYHACVLSYVAQTPFVYIESKPYCSRFVNSVNTIPPVDLVHGRNRTSRLLQAVLQARSDFFQYKIQREDAIKMAQRGILV